VGVDLGNAFHYFIPFLLCLIGFHGVLFHASPWGKTGAWCSFQLGLAVFLLQLASPSNPLPLALAWLVLAVTAALGILLALFCVKWGGRPKFSEGGKTSKRGSR